MTNREAFEAKVHAKRESGAGIFITLEVQPDDFSAALAMLRVGAHLIVGWEEVASTNVEPIEIGGGGSEVPVQGRVGAESNSVLPAAPEPKERRAFHTLPLAQQCAIRCGDERFIEWFKDEYAVPWMRRMHVQEFRDAEDGERTASLMREVLDVGSRSELGKGNHAADNAWRKLNSDFEAWELDQRYADVRR